MSLSVRRCAEPMNRICRFKVKVIFQGHGIYPLQLPVRFISPEPFERFSLNLTQMFLSARRCIEHMTQLWSLEVNVAVQGHGIYPWSWCLLHISRALWKSPKCSSQWDGVQKQWLSYQDFKRSWSYFEVMGYFYPRQFSVWLCLNDFFLKITQMLPSLRRCTEPMTQLRTVNVKLTLKGNGIYPSFYICLHRDNLKISSSL